MNYSLKILNWLQTMRNDLPIIDLFFMNIIPKSGGSQNRPKQGFCQYHILLLSLKTCSELYLCTLHTPFQIQHNIAKPCVEKQSRPSFIKVGGKLCRYTYGTFKILSRILSTQSGFLVSPITWIRFLSSAYAKTGCKIKCLHIRISCIKITCLRFQNKNARKSLFPYFIFPRFPAQMEFPFHLYWLGILRVYGFALDLALGAK